MEIYRPLNSRNVLVIKLLFILPLLTSTYFISAQSPADFSGNWVLDQAKSDASFKDYTVNCKIVQTHDSILIQESFIMKGGKLVTAPANSYGLDGKETGKEEYGGINKQSARWSADKKILTITITRTLGNNVYGSNSTYKLSETGRVLTVETTDIDSSSGMPAIIKVFNKE